MKRIIKVLLAVGICASFSEVMPAYGNISRVEAPVVRAPHSEYENVAVSQVSNYVNIRKSANTTSEVVGKIYNNCAATILATVAGEDGTWYQIQSGNVNGYIKAEYFITGEEAEKKAKEVGTEYATITNASTLRLREKPDLESSTLTLLAEGARYEVIEETGDFIKLAVDADLQGYVFKDYVKTKVEFKQAVSLEEERIKAADETNRKRASDEAIQNLNVLKEAAKNEAPTQSGTSGAAVVEAPTKVEETAAASTEGTTISPNPQENKEVTVAPPTQPAPTQAAQSTQSTQAAGPDSKGPGISKEVTSATRTAIVAYAKQFLGNPYVFGGTSLTNGADCSGFTQGVYSHFGITIGRSSRDQAAKGREIIAGAMQPGDLLFYASGNYINHVSMYIGGGQIIHASSPANGIMISPSNYRTPCKIVTFLD